MEKVLYRQYYEIEDEHWWFVARKAIVLGLLDSYVPQTPQRLVLDAGCGTGGLLKDLERYGKVIAADFSEEAVKFCKLRDHDSLIFRAVCENQDRASYRCLQESVGARGCVVVRGRRASDDSVGGALPG
jgi:SAM-dependent methyltransferase